jgi:hypothetical protein
MSYLGNTPTQQGFIPAIDFFSGNGITTAFTLSRPVASVAQVQATIENVPQNPGTAFTVSGNTITFDGAPASGTNNIYVYYTSPITQVIQPGQGTVGTAQFASGVTVPFGLGSASAPSIAFTGDSNTGIFSPGADSIGFTEGGAEVARFNSSGNLGIGISSPSGRLEVLSSAAADSTTSRLIVGYNDLGTSQIYYDAANHIWRTSSFTERMRIDSSGNLQFNSGYGSVATAYGCRAWVNFNGTGTVAIRASGNVSSVTDLGTGAYRVNLTTAMPDTNFAATLGHGYANDDTGYTYGVCFPLSSSQIRVNIARDGVGEADTSWVQVAVTR